MLSGFLEYYDPRLLTNRMNRISVFHSPLIFNAVISSLLQAYIQKASSYPQALFRPLVYATCVPFILSHPTDVHTIADFSVILILAYVNHSLLLNGEVWRQ